ncbi:MAG: permease [bacterium]
MAKGIDARGGSGAGRTASVRFLAFPAIVAIAYGVIALASAEQAMAALRASWRTLLQVAPALAVAFGVMVALNLLVTSAQIKRFLGKGTKSKGALLSSVAGILSMGPIYVWYPLLKDLREKDVSDFHLANFLGCRAVKIPLLPMMAAYFGWTFTLILSGLMVVEAMVTGLLVNRTGARRIER